MSSSKISPPTSATTSPTKSGVNESEPSPRSTVISQGSPPMTTNVSVMNETSTVGADSSNAKDSTKKTEETSEEPAPNPASPVNGDNKAGGEMKSSKDGERRGDDSPGSPQQTGSNPTQFAPQPQVGSAYYLGYPQTSEPPSPAQPGANVYDAASFFQQPSGAFAVPHSTAFGGGPNSSLSPPRGTSAGAAAAAATATAMGVAIPPASPLFPRVSSGGVLTGAAAPTAAALDATGRQQAAGGAPPSPNLPYMSPQLGTSSMYQPYPMASSAATESQSSDNSPSADGNAWNERSLPPQTLPQQSGYAQSSPQMMAYGGMAAAQNRPGRTYSFEDNMLPPSVLDQQQADQTGNPQYSPYSAGQSSPIPAGAATLFAHQSWGAYGGPPDMYSTPGSPLQPRPSAHPPMGMYAGAAAAAAAMNTGMRGAPYGQYYPASSPGPPIQTTASNKGPDGANLFIFHIPNHFTNLDMYQLFCPYGNLLSVRIMVEKDTGRSRGFGFVSYDSPESAALAIKELNGFAIGNKRLKVQHKQIRPKDLRNDRDGGFGDEEGSGYQSTQRSQFAPSSLPPSGPTASQNMWYDNRNPTSPRGNGAGAGAGGAADPDVTGANPGGGGGGSGDEGTSDLTAGTPTGAETTTQLQLGTSSESPLASLGTLQNALPDVPGKGPGTPE